MYPDPAPPVDRTGAGDSFASTVTSALALGKTLPEALSWGPINSMSVVQYIGAQKGLLHKDKLELLRSEAPEAYKPQRITV
jgi:sugar/nucleoside kinase (ribokinase family)